jgi:hypothetical protein
LVRITAPHFVAGLEASGGVVVVRVVPIINYMLGWDGRMVARYCGNASTAGPRRVNTQGKFPPVLSRATSSARSLACRAISTRPRRSVAGERLPNGRKSLRSRRRSTW